ncbi:MAG: permease [Oscillospiraceae bacterium]|nr:permease [Oscillospiraceae bacterium]MBQ7000250.1 permease [Oscillospiraceae bacterium]
MAFFVCFVGYALGAVQVKGLNLGTAGVFLFALLFGYLCTLPGLKEIPVLGKFYMADAADSKISSFKFLSNIGLVLFVTSVGSIAGPKFFRDLKVNAKTYVPMGALIITIGALVTVLFAMIPGIGPAYATGILSGALTSTPAFSAAKDTVAELAENQVGLVVLGQAVSYPFGVIGVVLFVQVMPRLVKADLAKERTLISAPVATAAAKDEKKRFALDEYGFAAFGLALVFGLLLGAIKIPLSAKGYAGPCFSLGTTGGPLIMSLILAHFGHIGPISMKTDVHALKSFREFGLMLFLLGAGVEGGVVLVQQISQSELGAMLVVYGFLAGVVITIIPMVVGYLFAKYICKLPLLSNLGSITGGMTSTPALGTLISTAGTEDVAGAYAATYPIALVLVVLANQLINSLMLA